jgi:hypothetical protein
MLSSNISIFSTRLQIKRGMVFGLLIVTALLAFELFNYSTTDFALSDLLGELKFMGVRWATILAIAFCGIDFAGIARLFTPEQGADEPAEVWYLFGAWMLAALMNAMLTWWGVSIAILNHQTLGNAVVARETLLNVVPIFIAIMVWLIRVLIIGTISMAGDRLFSQAKGSQSRSPRQTRRQTSNHTDLQKRSPSNRPFNNSRSTTVRRGVSASQFRPFPKAESQHDAEPEYEQLEPTYSPVSFKSTRDNSSRQARF